MRLTVKLLLISELVLLITVLGLVIPVWRAMREQVITNMQNELKAIASTAALEIDGDLHSKIRSMADAESEAFATLRSRLAKVQRANDIKINHLYTFYPDGDRMRFAVMLNPADQLFIGNPYPRQPLMTPVLEQGTMEATALYSDEFGQWISAYAPIKDSHGDVVGLLAVDKDSGEYFAEFNYYTRLTIALGILALVVSSLLGWAVLRRFVIRPMAAVREGMLALGRHDFAHEVRLKTMDEFQELGETLNSIAKQLNVAKLVQSRFFPERLPQSESYRMAAVSEPCDAAGGDYFDAFELPDGRTAILVADVSGHGLGPALLMATCRAHIRALGNEGLPPAELVERVDRLLRDDLHGGRFITLVLGVLTRDGTFTYSNAGHGPALLYTQDGVRQLKTHRPPLGVEIDLEDEELETSVQLARGDRIFIASDGLVEVQNTAGQAFGVARVTEVVTDLTRTSEEVVRRLGDLLSRYLDGARKTDDVTMLCVDRL